MSDVKFKIYPAIGIARVGNSKNEFYIGPETVAGLPILPDGCDFEATDFRAPDGTMKRQAARFSIYRCNEDGVSEEEVTLNSPGIKAIRWNVHIANKKASWYEFQTLNGENGYASNHPLRNPQATTVSERQSLNIDPGPRDIIATTETPEPVPFSKDNVPQGYPASFPPELTANGTDKFEIDNLGELRCQKDGRLLVLGGHGHSGTSDKTPALPEYANNDNWWDDTSDGPVRAVIEFDDGSEVEVDNAWVLVGPPSYAPEVLNLVSLYDTIYDTSVRNMGANPAMFENGFWKKGADGYKPDFESEIKPILQRGEHYPWVVAIPPKAHSFDYDMLGNPEPGYNGLRKYFVDILRAPTDPNTLISSKNGSVMMPYLAGDASIGAYSKTASKYLTLTDTQYFLIQQWGDGNFVNNTSTAIGQGEALTQAVLENCVGGAFSPGIEMTWISRNPNIYSEPFRIRDRGPVAGPLGLGFDPQKGMEPGDITRYMALPWQADFNECSSQPIGDRVLWWWPAQRPAFVYVEGMGENEDDLRQVPWLGTGYDQNADNYIMFNDNVKMVNHWQELGFIYNKGDEASPRFVEVERTLPRTNNPNKANDD